MIKHWNFLEICTKKKRRRKKNERKEEILYSVRLAVEFVAHELNGGGRPTPGWHVEVHELLILSEWVGE